MRIRYGVSSDGKPVKKAEIYTSDEHKIDLQDIDSSALKIIRRLRKAGFKSYIVGGAVRDLLLGSQPKDFDIATDARPRQSRSLFINSRIIGRRFRIVISITTVIKLLKFPPFGRGKNQLPIISMGLWRKMCGGGILLLMPCCTVLLSR